MISASETPPAEPAIDWWNPGKSMREIHESDARVMWLVGARGSGKTGMAGMEAIRHGFHIAGAKAMFLRKTEASQNDTTIDTIVKLFERMGELYQDTGDSLFKSWNNYRSIRIPSLKAIEAFNAAKPTWESRADRMAWIETEGARLCSYIEFRGLPHAGSRESKLRGFECSLLILVEADQLTEEDFQMAVPCIRWKGSDPATCDKNGFIINSGIIVETNPPSPRHWIARTEEETKKGEHPDYRFWHIKTAENAENLPPGYVSNLRTLYKRNPAMMRRMVDGEYAEAFDGTPVFWNYDQVANVGEDLPWVPGAYLVRGWDFGTFNSVVWFQYWSEGGREYLEALAEQYLEGSDTDRQATMAVKFTASEFCDPVTSVPYWNDRSICAGVLDFCDPAGMNSNYGMSRNANGEKIGSCVEILNTHGIRPGTLLWQKRVKIGVTIINRFLELRDHRGRAQFRIDSKNCPHLHAAFSGGYRFPSPGEPGHGGDDPLKGIHNGIMDYSHLADPARYVFLNVMKLEKNKYEESKKPLFRQREIDHRKPVNAARRL